MKTVEINNIPFDIHEGPIGIGASGGADSSILLYILMKYAPGPIYVFTCASERKHRVAPHIALNVIGKCIDLTERDDVLHHTFFVKDQTYDALFDPLTNFLHVKYVNYMYMAGTALPPTDVLESFNLPAPLLDKRDPNVQRPLYTGKYYSPLWNVNKKVISDLYDTLGVRDELYTLTRSCEDLTITAGHCGQCWWCKERKWAFGRLF